MSAPLLTCIIPTIGRDTLARTLASIRCQAPTAECELLIVGDLHGGTWRDALQRVPAVCAAYEAAYLGWDGGLHMVGQPQRQEGMRHARGQWLAWSQDDAAWAVGAWAAMTASLARPPRCPRLFCVHTWQAGTIPRVQTVQLGNVDADGIVVPNESVRLGRWANTYTGDYEFIRETVDLWDGQVVFEPVTIAIGRPDPRRQIGGVRMAG